MVLWGTLVLEFPVNIKKIKIHGTSSEFLRVFLKNKLKNWQLSSRN
jgi:hypothetical protein